MGKLLDQVVVPFLEKAGLVYQRKDEAIVTGFQHDEFRHGFLIAEVRDGQMIGIREELGRLVASPERLRDIADQLNRLGPGKYFASSNGGLLFYYGHLWTGEMSPQSFRVVFDAVLEMIEERHEIVMRIAWGGMTLEQAVDYQRKRTRNDQRWNGRRIPFCAGLSERAKMRTATRGTLTAGST